VQVAVFGTARRPHFCLAIISVTVQLWIYVFWVISVYFNIRDTLPKSGTFLLGHTVYRQNTTIFIRSIIDIAGGKEAEGLKTFIGLQHVSVVTSNHHQGATRF